MARTDKIAGGAIIALILMLIALVATLPVSADARNTCKHEHWHEHHGDVNNYKVTGNFDTPGVIVAAKFADSKPPDGAGFVWEAYPGVPRLWVKKMTVKTWRSITVPHGSGPGQYGDADAVQAAYPGKYVQVIRTFTGEHTYSLDHHRGDLDSQYAGRDRKYRSRQQY